MSKLSVGKKRLKMLRFLTCSIALVLLNSYDAIPQGKDERPKVHTDFKFGAFPYSPEAQERFLDVAVVRLIIGFHEGWSLDKFVNETKSNRREVLALTDELEEAHLIRGRSDYNLRPGFPVLRESELRFILPELTRHGDGLTGLIENHWNKIEEFLNSLEGARKHSRTQVLYQVVISGVLLGGMLDAFYDDRTLLAGEPRRSRRGQGFYAWMTEGNAGPIHLVQQKRRLGRYQLVSVGNSAEKNLLIPINDLKGHVPVYEGKDARRWSVFTSLFSRDYLLPYFKSQREDIIGLHEQLRASRYTALAEFVAWYYQSLVADVTGRLVSKGYIEAPETSYKYVMRIRK